MAITADNTHGAAKTDQSIVPVQCVETKIHCESERQPRVMTMNQNVVKTNKYTFSSYWTNLPFNGIHLVAHTENKVISHTRQLH